VALLNCEPVVKFRDKSATKWRPKGGSFYHAYYARAHSTREKWLSKIAKRGKK
jgi:hypothetical protein